MNNIKKEQDDRESIQNKEEVYLDSNLLISSVISIEKEGESARKIIGKVKQGKLKGYTATLTLDEVMWIVQKYKDRDTAYETGNTILGIPNLRFISIDHQIISRALEIYKVHNFGPRDAIHLAAMQSKKVKTIISSDSDFDKIKGVRRIDFTKI